MKKIAVLMILVLCAVMLGGCMGSGAGSSVADAVAFIRFDATDDINLTVDKDNKVLAVTYGVDSEKAPINKNNTVYKDIQLVGKSLADSVAEIIKANGEEFATLKIAIVSAKKSNEEVVKSVKEELPKAIEETFKTNNKALDVVITLSIDEGKTFTEVVNKKAADYLPETEEETEGTTSEAE